MGKAAASPKAGLQRPAALGGWVQIRKGKRKNDPC